MGPSCRSSPADNIFLIICGGLFQKKISLLQIKWRVTEIFEKFNSILFTRRNTINC